VTVGPSKKAVVNLLRRLGYTDRIAEAERELPDPVDLERDRALLERLGLERDAVINELGGSPL
jgi:hypothetical protein